MHHPLRDRFARTIGIRPARAAVLVVALITGCGGDRATDEGQEPRAASAPAEQQTNGTRSGDEAPSGSEQTASSTAADSDAVHTDSDGRKWIGDIPYDVWFEDPVAVANNERPVGGETSPPGESEPSPMPDSSGGDASTPPEDPASDEPADFWAATDWPDLIPAAVVESETKRIRNRLRQFLQTLGKYNAHYQEIEVDGVTLAALGTIAHHHPGSVNWKEQALVVRDLGTAIADASTSLGREAYETAQQPYESLAAILRGSRPSGVSGPDPDAGLLFTVYRTGVMKRMERAHNRLSKNINTESAFREDPETVLHEASLLGALGRLASHPEYPSAEEEKYQEYAGDLVEASLEIKQAVQNESFTKYDQALDRVQKSCAACHSDYRFAGDDFGL